MKNVRVRFAPSPTGIPHIGNIRTALFAWILAKKHNGKFILRIEDTDQNRYDPQSELAIIESMNWLGLAWDEGPEIGGNYGPYRQSERKNIYIDIAEKLIESGKAYYDDTTPEQLESLRKHQKEQKLPPRYDGRGRKRTEEQIKKSREKGVPITVRLKVPDFGKISFIDKVRGKIEIDAKEIDDFVILKSDNMPTYHLAHVVDDHLMKISHVIRAEEWISSTPRHILIHQALNYSLPEYVHVPLILGSDKSKLSKRHGSTSVLEYKKQGFINDALFNFLSLLGWSPGDDRELLSKEEIISEFELNKINSSSAIFDLNKLEWMNGVYIRGYSNKELIEKIKPILESENESIGLPKSIKRPLDESYLIKIIPLIKERIKTLNEISELIDFFYDNNIKNTVENIIIKKLDSSETIRILNKSINILNDIKSFKSELLESSFRNLVEIEKIKPGQLFTSLRFALSGKKIAPPLFETMEVLGRAKCIKRVSNAIMLVK
ncbi:MAG: glutamate--tRNA ligase [Chloroflexi bacterium]|nr:glutamate--tRNA ligase [Chloroflexota bacterium]